MNAFFEAPRVAVVGEPVGAGVILHRSEGATFLVEDDRNSAEGVDLVTRKNDADLGQLGGEKGECLRPEFFIRAPRQESVVDEDRKAFDRPRGAGSRLSGLRRPGFCGGVAL